MSHSVPLVAGRKGMDIDDIAFKLVEAFQPDAVRMVTKFEVEKFFEFELKKQTGVEPVYQPLGYGLEGLINIEAMKCIICANAANYGESDMKRRRLRATQAHEIGHCHLHVAELRQTRAARELRHDTRHADSELFKQEEIKVYRNPEWQAWRFAGALLMPECCVRAAIYHKWTMKMMSRAFDVNIAFLEVRLHTLRIPDRVRMG